MIILQLNSIIWTITITTAAELLFRIKCTKMRAIMTTLGASVKVLSAIVIQTLDTIIIKLTYGNLACSNMRTVSARDANSAWFASSISTEYSVDLQLAV